MQNNSNLRIAQKAKQDEFYTMLTDIEKEMQYYKNQFKDMVVYCNCDDARESNFFKYFSLNFEFLGLKKLIATAYKENGRGVILTYEGDKNGNRMVDDEEIKVTELQGDGDFRSEECIELLKQADIVVTNPPFSIFREYIATLMQYDKKFLVIGNKNAITYKEIFPYIKDAKLWLGKTIPNDFRMPNGETTKMINGLCRWFTNMETNKQVDAPMIINTYSEKSYPKYDNYNAINVDKVKDIPYDYDGVVGVPITIIDKLCSDGYIHFDCPNLPQRDIKYEILEEINRYSVLDVAKTNDYAKANHLYFAQVNGKQIYSRIIIQKVK